MALLIKLLFVAEKCINQTAKRRYVFSSKPADVAKLAYAPALGAGAARHGGSSPPVRT